MVVEPIGIAGDPVLQNPTRIVSTSADGSVPSGAGCLIADVFETLTASKEVGLSANQIGANLQLFVYDCPEVRGALPRHCGCVVNPRIEDLTMAGDYA